MDKKAFKEYIAWCKRNYASLSDVGIWAVPRSGLIFKRTPYGYKLDEVMPFTPELATAVREGRGVPVSAQWCTTVAS